MNIITSDLDPVFFLEAQIRIRVNPIPVRNLTLLVMMTRQTDFLEFLFGSIGVNINKRVKVRVFPRIYVPWSRVVDPFRIPYPDPPFKAGPDPAIEKRPAMNNRM